MPNMPRQACPTPYGVSGSTRLAGAPLERFVQPGSSEGPSRACVKYNNATAPLGEAVSVKYRLELVVLVVCSRVTAPRAIFAGRQGRFCCLGGSQLFLVTLSEFH